jgi:hypothetical protein
MAACPCATPPARVVRTSARTIKSTLASLHIQPSMYVHTRTTQGAGIQVALANLRFPACEDRRRQRSLLASDNNVEDNLIENLDEVLSVLNDVSGIMWGWTFVVRVLPCVRACVQGGRVHKGVT